MFNGQLIILEIAVIAVQIAIISRGYFVTFDMNSKTTLMKTLFCHSVIHNTAEEMYNNVNEFLNLNEIKLSKCVGISTDGANNSLIKWHHCFIHRVALANKKMPEKLKKLFDKVVKIVNFIKARHYTQDYFMSSASTWIMTINSF